MILAVLVFIRKVTQTTTVSEATTEYIREGHVHILQHKEIPAYVSIFRIHGPFLFGATDKIDAISLSPSRSPTHHYSETPEHDCNRFHWPSGTGEFCRPRARIRATTSFFVGQGNSRRCECMRLNFTSMWARRISAEVWLKPSTGPEICTPKPRSNIRRGPAGADEVPMFRCRRQH